MTLNVIKSIVQKYPELSEKYLEFLSSLNISFDEDVQNTDLSLVDAEKFIVSFKLQRYIKSLNNEKQEILKNALENNISDSQVLQEVDDKIREANEKLEKLLDINN